VLPERVSHKTLDEWMNVGVGLFNMASWAECFDAEMELAKFERQSVRRRRGPCTQDRPCQSLQGLYRISPQLKSGVDERHYFVFANHYAPLALINDGEHPHYQKWMAAAG